MNRILRVLAVALLSMVLVVSLSCSQVTTTSTKTTTTSVATTASPSPTATAGPPKDLVVGFSVDLSGTAATTGIAAQRSANMAAAEINQAGGIDVGGQKYLLKIEVL